MRAVFASNAVRSYLVTAVAKFFLAMICRRHRKIEPRDSPYVVKPETVSIGTSSVTLEIENTEKNIIFSAELNSLTDGRARLRIREKNPIRHRYEVQGALIGEPELER